MALAECRFGPENVGAAVTLDSDLPPNCCYFTRGRRAFWFPRPIWKKFFAWRVRMAFTRLK